MAIDEDSANFPGGANWPSRLRGAWAALLGRSGGPANAGRAVFAGERSVAHPQALLMESLIGGLPDPAIVLDRDGRVISFNSAASGIAPALAPRRAGLDHLAHAGTGRGDPPCRRHAGAAARGIFRARAARPLVRGLRHPGDRWRPVATDAPTFC